MWQRDQKKKPSPESFRGWVLATSYSRTTYRRTTIGAAAFHFRVRNGNGWCHCAMITRVERRNLAAQLWSLQISDCRLQIVWVPIFNLKSAFRNSTDSLISTYRKYFR